MFDAATMLRPKRQTDHKSPPPERETAHDQREIFVEEWSTPKTTYNLQQDENLTETFQISMWDTNKLIDTISLYEQQHSPTWLEDKLRQIHNIISEPYPTTTILASSKAAMANEIKRRKLYNDDTIFRITIGFPGNSGLTA